MGGWEEEEEEKSKGDKKREEKRPAADDGEGPRRTQKGMQRRTGEQKQQPAATEVAAKEQRSRSGGGGEQAREREGTSWEQENERYGSFMGTYACAFRPFFLRLPTRPTWNNNALSAQPHKKNCFQKILLSGSPTTEFYFPKKLGRSVSNSYFYSCKLFFIKIRIRFLYFIYIRVLFMPYNTLPNYQKISLKKFFLRTVHICIISLCIS